MTYPDGLQIHVGDLIWWDEGHCVGYVQAIAESREDYESWGLDSPHIFVCNRHPFDPALATSSGVAYGASFLEDEGIGPLSAAERLEFERATQLALAGRSYSCYSVTTHVEGCTTMSWIFHLIDAQGLQNIVPIPYDRPAAS